MRRREQGGAGGFLPLADIFTSAMACILILLTLSSRNVQVLEENERPKADAVYRCIEPARSPRGGLEKDDAAGDQLVARVYPVEKARSMRTRELAGDLSTLVAPDRLSIRVVLLVAPGDRACPRGVAEHVSRLNERFEASSLGAGGQNAEAVLGHLIVLETALTAVVAERQR